MHLSIDKWNNTFLKKYKRQVFTTPKSFLEMIDFYKSLLQEKRD